MDKCSDCARLMRYRQTYKSAFTGGYHKFSGARWLILCYDRTFLTIPILLCIVLTLILFSQAQAQTNRPQNEQTKQLKQAVETAGKSVKNYTRRGIVTAKNRLKINSQISATVSKLYAEEGAQFKKNDLLIEFDCSIERAALEEARLSHEVAKFDYDKKQREAEEIPVSSQSLELLKLKTELALTKLNHIRGRMKNCRLLAPFSGRVLKVLVREYETAAALAPVMEVIDDQPFYFRVFLPLIWLQKLSIGDNVKIDIMGKNYPAELSDLSQEVDPLDQSIKALLRFKSQDGLKLGMNGIAKFKALK